MSRPGAQWRVAARLAWRHLRHTRLGSALIVVLVALPIAGATAAAVIVTSVQATTPEASSLLGGLSVAAAYVVVLLTGAAFAVSAHRQQRTLALASSAGASPADLLRVMLLQAAALAGAGGIIGVGVGIAAAALGLALWGAESSQLDVPWASLLAIGIVAVLVGTLAAMPPAVTVSLGDPITSLREAPRPRNLGARRPLWGSLLLAAGIGSTIVSTVMLALLATGATFGGNPQLRYTANLGMMVGAILTQLGIVLSGRWLLWGVARVMSRISLSARLASRDAAANGGRTVPAVAAIGAAVFIAVFAVASGTMEREQEARGWTYTTPTGAPAIGWEFYADSVSPDVTSQLASDASDVLRSVGATRVATISEQPDFWGADLDAVSPERLRAMAVMPERNRTAMLEAPPRAGDPTNNMAVVSADDIDLALNVTLTTAQRDAFEDGAALVRDERLVTDGSVQIAAWTLREVIFGTVDNDSPGSGSVAPQWSHTVEAVPVAEAGGLWEAVISPEVAAQLGLEWEPAYLVGAVDAPLSGGAINQLSARAEALGSDENPVRGWVDEGPESASVWLIPLLGGVFVFVIGASGISLALARFERRSDDATLAAVGAGAMLRRNVAFWQGLVIAGFGAATGALAGILPPIGFWLARRATAAWLEPYRLSDIPWALLAVLVVGLPFVIAVINWLVPPRAPDVTRRTAIA